MEEIVTYLSIVFILCVLTFIYWIQQRKMRRIHVFQAPPFQTMFPIVPGLPEKVCIGCHTVSVPKTPHLQGSIIVSWLLWIVFFPWTLAFAIKYYFHRRKPSTFLKCANCEEDLAVDLSTKTAREILGVKLLPISNEAGGNWDGN